MSGPHNRDKPSSKDVIKHGGCLYMTAEIFPRGENEINSGSKFFPGQANGRIGGFRKIRKRPKQLWGLIVRKEMKEASASRYFLKWLQIDTNHSIITPLQFIFMVCYRSVCPGISKLSCGMRVLANF